MIVQNPRHLSLAAVFAQRFTPDIFAQLEPLHSLAQRWIDLADREERKSGRGEHGGRANQAPQRDARTWQRF